MRQQHAGRNPTEHLDRVSESDADLRAALAHDRELRLQDGRKMADLIHQVGQAEARVEAIRSTLSFRLSHALVTTRSLRDVLTFGHRIRRAYREYRFARRAKSLPPDAVAGNGGRDAVFLRAILHKLETDSLPAAARIAGYVDDSTPRERSGWGSSAFRGIGRGNCGSRLAPFASPTAPTGIRRYFEGRRAFPRIVAFLALRAANNSLSLAHAETL